MLTDLLMFSVPYGACVSGESQDFGIESDVVTLLSHVAMVQPAVNNSCGHEHFGSGGIPSWDF